MPKETYKIPELPLRIDCETTPILKALKGAHRRLAELRGFAATIPNQSVLIRTLSLQEAKASSEIENIITTQDEILKSSAKINSFATPAAKEVHKYSEALLQGYDEMRRDGILTNRMIIAMFQTLKETQEEFRRTPGTVLRNDQSGATVYVPPQHYDDIVRYMGDFAAYLNAEPQGDIDPLIKMAIIHHQFESIHPFSDGNGRLGRVLSVLCLVKDDLLDNPILYMSRFITEHKDKYYRLLQKTRDDGDWEEWILFILEAVETTALQTTKIVQKMGKLMAEYKQKLRTLPKKLYSHDLLNNLFRHPYTRIEYVMDEVSVSRPTATRYLNLLAKSGLLVELRIGKDKYYINDPLVKLFSEG